jgi:hypothetical protein
LRSHRCIAASLLPSQNDSLRLVAVHDVSPSGRVATTTVRSDANRNSEETESIFRIGAAETWRERRLARIRWHK